MTLLCIYGERPFHRSILAPERVLSIEPSSKEKKYLLSVRGFMVHLDEAPEVFPAFGIVANRRGKPATAKASFLPL